MSWNWSWMKLVIIDFWKKIWIFTILKKLNIITIIYNYSTRFDALLRDVFPDVVFKDIEYEHLRQAIVDVCNEMSLVVNQNQVRTIGYTQLEKLKIWKIFKFRKFEKNQNLKMNGISVYWWKSEHKQTELLILTGRFQLNCPSFKMTSLRQRVTTLPRSTMTSSSPRRIMTSSRHRKSQFLMYRNLLL